MYVFTICIYMNFHYGLSFRSIEGGGRHQMFQCVRLIIQEQSMHDKGNAPKNAPWKQFFLDIV